MQEHDGFLAALQHADSFFPSGSIAFSWGLEMLRQDEQVNDADTVRSFIRGQLLGRWRTCDLPAICAAFRAGGDLTAVRAVDRELEALSLARTLREGSRRAGGAVLNIHEKLNTPGAAAYRILVRRGEAPGHLAAVQGLLWSGVGVTESAAAAMSAYTQAVGLLGAAVRLAIIGHVDAQRSLAALRPLIANILEEPPVAMEALSSYAPAAEVAAMRHETQDARLFSN